MRSERHMLALGCVGTTESSPGEGQWARSLAATGDASMWLWKHGSPRAGSGCFGRGPEGGHSVTALVAFRV